MNSCACSRVLCNDRFVIINRGAIAPLCFTAVLTLHIVTEKSIKVKHLTDETIAEHDQLKEAFFMLERTILELRHGMFVNVMMDMMCRRLMRIIPRCDNHQRKISF